jgi:virginiamycin B lyase
MLKIPVFHLPWPNGPKMSTHELVISSEYVYVTGQNNGYVAQIGLDGQVHNFFPMLDERGQTLGPHGLLLDAQQRLWVSLEFIGQVVRLDENGHIVERINVNMSVEGSKRPINPAPHGICLGVDGQTIWFTGKRTSTIGRINPDRTVEHFEINTLAAMPIFLQAGPGGFVWGTELLGNSILRVDPTGLVQETPIPTKNSRPIGIIPDPSGRAMWFTEEAGRNVGKVIIGTDGIVRIQEYRVPVLHENDLLGSLSFDREGCLWVQVYSPVSEDYLVQLYPTLLQIEPDDMPKVEYKIHPLTSHNAMLHRIRMDRAGNLWFTTMMTDTLSKVQF